MNLRKNYVDFVDNVDMGVNILWIIILKIYIIKILM